MQSRNASDYYAVLVVLLFWLNNHINAQFQDPSAQFIPNKGQIVDINNNPRPDVLFKSALEGIYLRTTGLSFVQAKFIHPLPKIDLDKQFFSKPNEVVEDTGQEPVYNRHQVDLEFLNTLPDPEVSGELPTADYHNYYLSQCPDGITGVYGCRRISYQNIYEKVDVIFNIENGLKYDFVIHPGGSYEDIEMQWKGADSVRINTNGELVVATHFNPITESIPLVYQIINGDTVKISAEYILEQGLDREARVRFKLDEYDKSHDLIIDPWITNYGGEGDDYGLEVDTDTDGNVYMSGETISITAIAEAGFQMEKGFDGSDAFLAKFNEFGERLWATYYGSDAAGRERGNGVVTDLGENVYLGGVLKGPGMATPGAFQTDYMGGSYDSFIAKFDPEGTRIWATYFGGEGEDYAMNIGIDGQDNVFLCGYNLGFSDLAYEGFQMVSGGFADGFLVKFNSDGDRIWSTFYGGVNAELMHDVEGDGHGNVFVSGITTSPDGVSSPGAYQEVMGGGQDAFLVKFNSDGSRDWATYYGQLWVERGDAVAVDMEGNVYMGGKNTSPEDGATPGAFQTSNGGISDGFVGKYDTEGNLLWMTYLGGDSIDYVYGLDVDPITNNVIAAGQTYSEDFPTAPCAIQDELVGFLNAFVTQFFPDGELFCSSYLAGDDEEENVPAVSNCWIYVTGTTSGDISTPGAHQATAGGELDAFLGRVHISSCEMTRHDITEYDQSQEDVTSCTPCNGSATIDLSDFCLHPRSLKSFVWSNGHEEIYTTDITSTIEGLCEGEYWVEVTIYCDVVDTFYFDIGNTASITADYNVLLDDLSTCVGNTVDFENLSSTIFGEIISNSWDFGDGGGSDLENPGHVYDESGTYEITLLVENDSECQDSLVQTIEVFPVYDIVVDTVICEDETFVFPDGESIIVIGNTSRSYNLTSIHGCDSSYTINLTSVSSFLETKNVTLNEGDTYTFPDGSGVIVNADTSQTSIFNTETNCDSVIVTNIVVIPKPQPEIDSWLKAPNIFTPGGTDEVNQTFYFPAEGIETFTCFVINRWGQEVFRFNSITDVWDGLNIKTGIQCTDGVYFYSYTGTYVSGESFKGQGNVHLISE